MCIQTEFRDHRQCLYYNIDEQIIKRPCVKCTHVWSRAEKFRFSIFVKQFPNASGNMIMIFSTNSVVLRTRTRDRSRFRLRDAYHFAMFISNECFVIFSLFFCFYNNGFFSSRSSSSLFFSFIFGRTSHFWYINTCLCVCVCVCFSLMRITQTSVNQTTNKWMFTK